jgi:hypothetical protein
MSTDVKGDAYDIGIGSPFSRLVSIGKNPPATNYPLRERKKQRFRSKRPNRRTLILYSKASISKTRFKET